MGGKKEKVLTFKSISQNVSTLLELVDGIFLPCVDFTSSLFSTYQNAYHEE